MTNKNKPKKQIVLGGKPGSSCENCGSNARLLTYRRNGDSGKPTYMCASCIHEDVDER